MSRGIEAALWGNATKDGEVRQSKAGNEFAVVNLMTQDGSTDEDGKPGVVFVKVLAFSQHVNAARLIKKGDRVYVEGQFSASIWKTNDGQSRLDLTIRAFKVERTGIGKNRPPRSDAPASFAPAEKPASRDRPAGEQAPQPAVASEFNDEIGF